MRAHLSILIALVASCTYGDGPVKVSLTLGRQDVAIGDCQIVRVVVDNRSQKAVILDDSLNVRIDGPEFEFQRGDEPPFAVTAVGQGRALAARGEPTVVSPGGQVACLAVLFSHSSENGHRPLFDLSGKAAFRAAVSVGGRPTWSDWADCNVRIGDAVRWESKDVRLELMHMLSALNPPIDQNILTKLPRESLIASIADYSVRAKAVLSQEDVKLKAWRKGRMKEGDVVSDYAAERLASALLSKQRHKEALVEVESMGVRSYTAEQIAAEAKQVLDRPIPGGVQ